MKMRTGVLFSLVLLFLLSSGSVAVAESVSRHTYSILQKAYTLMQEEKYTESLAALQPLLGGKNKNTKKNPSSYALSYAALCYGYLDKGEEALKILQRAVALYPEKQIFWYNLGIFQMQAGDYQGAVETYRKLIVYSAEQDVQDVVHYNLAFALYNLAQYGEAIEVLDTIPAKVHSSRQWLELKLYCHIGLEHWQAAEQVGLEILAFAPDAANIWTLLGQICANQQKVSRATAYLEISSILAPDKSREDFLGRLYGVQSAWNELVRHQRTAGKSGYTLARWLAHSCQYQQALDELGGNVPGQDMESALFRGQMLFVLGMKKQAIAELSRVEGLPLLFKEHSGMSGEDKKAKRQYRDRLSARALLLSGQILWLEQRWEEARDIFKKLELLPGQEEFGKSLARCMQSLLLEKQRVVQLPGILDPPLILNGL